MKIYYLGARFTSCSNTQIETLRTVKGLAPFARPRMGFHTTIVHSREPFTFPGYLRLPPQNLLTLLGTSLGKLQNSVVAYFDSSDSYFRALHKICRQGLATFDHDEYTPHVTLAVFTEESLASKALEESSKYPAKEDIRIRIDVRELYYREWEEKES